MVKYVIKRILLMLMTLLIITCMCFVLVRMLPPAELPLNDIHTKVIEARREAQGYNKPYLVQFGIYLRDIFTKFDWGVSDKLYFGQDVASIFLNKLPATVVVNLYSILLSIPIGIALGIWAALKKNTWLDYTISTLTMVGTDWFSWSMFVSMLPAVLASSFGTIAGFTRTTRAELTEVLTSEFMLLARTKGLTRAQATIRHAMKNCMVVILPAIFGSFISIMSGSLIIEKIFAIPGVGNLYLNAINARDYNIFMLDSVFYTAVSLLAGIVIDISYGFIDPRIRMGSKK